MTAPLELLIYRLTERGIILDYIPALVRDVLRIIGKGGVFTQCSASKESGQIEGMK